PLGKLDYTNVNDSDDQYFLAIRMSLLRPACRTALGLSLTAGFAAAQESEFRLVIKDHKFVPAEITVPAGKKIKLVIENQDATAEEFESYELNREKVVPGKGQITIFVGPLSPGHYPFFGDFHTHTSKAV